ncbi:unnamed protein product [Larinioides sclopetarius]|uniref:Uncharacterized protein n=1 Tax=Larinioides sclopetarius TaxID=280406 RepID=A0AAV2C1L1_9ARAC
MYVKFVISHVLGRVI